MYGLMLTKYTFKKLTFVEKITLKLVFLIYYIYTHKNTTTSLFCFKHKLLKCELTQRLAHFHLIQFFFKIQSKKEEIKK